MPEITRRLVLVTHTPSERSTEDLMHLRLELIAVPVADVDRAKAFYVDQRGAPSNKTCTSMMGTGSSRSSARLGMLQRAHRRPHRLATWLAFRHPVERRRRGCGAPLAKRTRCGGIDDPGLPVGPLRVLQGPRRQRAAGQRTRTRGVSCSDPTRGAQVGGWRSPIHLTALGWQKRHSPLSLSASSLGGRAMTFRYSVPE